MEGEFAVRFKDASSNTEGTSVFYPLQIRPIVSARECIDEDLTIIPKQNLLLYSARSLGNGVVNDVYDVIYLKEGAFSMATNRTIAEEIRNLNRNFATEGDGYILIGEGRWGSSDMALGVPVEWSDISAARLIAELSVDGRYIEPSQGTHFFQNLTSFGVGYLTVGSNAASEHFDRNWLNAQPAIWESALVRHVRCTHPLVIKMDGLHSVGVVEK